MKKTLTKVMAMLCATVACAPLAACGDGGNGTSDKDVDTLKAQLYVSNFNGGVGYEWLDNVIARFEADYAETEFIPGKKGVQVWVSNHKSGMADLGPKMKTAKEEVYFLENVNYYDSIAQGYMLDITDMVTEKLTEYGEEQSVEDKLYDDQVDFYKTANGKYYGIPHAQSPTMITYDADLFDRLNLYFDESGKIGKKSTDSGLSKGPDNVAGTYDDGLPATYDQFFEMCAAMKKRGVSPFVWSGMYEFYVTRFSKQLKTDFEGPAEAKVAYTFDGTEHTHLVDSIDAEGNITYKDPVKITEENGYEIYSSAGYYHAFDFLEKIYDNGYYSNKSFNEGISHTDAQSTFLISSFTSEQDVAMLIEGLWWVNEARPTFKEMATYPKASLQERNLKLMPLPKATEEQVGEKMTLVDSLNQMAFISAYIDEEKVELAKTFLQYCETQKSLEEFLATTGLTRSYEVDYSNIYDSLSPYSKSVVDVLSNCNYILPSSDAEILQKNYTAFRDYEIGTTAYPDPMIAIKEGKSAAAFFQDIRTKYNETSWAALLNK